MSNSRKATFKIVPQKVGVGYVVYVTVPNEVDQQISGFRSEAEAEAWVQKHKKAGTFARLRK